MERQTAYAIYLTDLARVNQNALDHIKFQLEQDDAGAIRAIKRIVDSRDKEITRLKSDWLNSA